MTVPILEPADFLNPAIRLTGEVDYAMYDAFRAQLDAAEPEGLVVVALSTLGGDPEVARMMGEDIRLQTQVRPERRLVFLGKTAIYSAGTTFMSFFATENRYLTRGARLMVHERKMDKVQRVEGPLTTCVSALEATLNEIRTSITIQEEGFANLIFGSAVTMEEVRSRATSNWYIEAEDALAMKLVSGVI